MNAHERALAVIRIGDSLHARLLKDILDTTLDPHERNQILAGTLGMVLRRSVQSIPVMVDQQDWLAEIVKMAVA